jgi:Mrp family chromosome partitioning ATPase
MITLVVSPGAGDGKTSLAVNLAAAFLETGQRTIAVNTDFRRPRMHEAITGTPSPELPYDIHELDELPRQALPLETTSTNLRILDLHTVPGSPGQLVRASIRQMERLTGTADQIVVDTSPVGATAEVLELVPLADVIVLVIRVGHTSIESAERTIAILRDLTNAPIVFVLGGIKTERSKYDEYNGKAAGRREETGSISRLELERT